MSVSRIHIVAVLTGGMGRANNSGPCGDLGPLGYLYRVGAYRPVYPPSSALAAQGPYWGFPVRPLLFGGVSLTPALGHAIYRADEGAAKGTNSAPRGRLQ